MSGQIIDMAIQELQDPALHGLSVKIEEALTENPIDTSRLGGLAWNALQNSKDTSGLERAAYKSLYWRAEEKLLELEVGQQG